VTSNIVEKGASIMRRRHFIIGAAGSACLLIASFAGSAPVGATYSGVNGRIAFGMSVEGGNVEIFSVLPNGHELSQLTELPGFNACANYSPDGRSIAWCAGAAPGNSEIWAMKANGKAQHQVTHLDGFMTFPNYSPDGTRIAFGGNLPGDSKQAVFVIGTDGTAMIRLTDDSSNNSLPAWSPDGTRVAFVSDRTGLPQVWVMKSDGTNPVQLTTDPFPKAQLPDWSPDGTKIAFASVDATGGPDIFLMNSDGSNPTQLTSHEAVNFAPRWSPDGTKIAFVTSRDLPPTARTVYIMDADGSAQHSVRPGGRQLAPSWQPLPLDGESD
jgi:TolB protein